MTTRISDYFVGVAARRLSEVEINANVSHQHEFAATRAVRAFLGETEPKVFDARLVYVEDDVEPFVEITKLTYYDTRRNQPHRASEYRLYYTKNEITELSSAGDLILVARSKQGELLVVFARQGSTIESQIQWLFGLDPDGTNLFQSADADAFNQEITPRNIDVLLDAFGIDVEVDEPDHLEELFMEFGENFPTTKEFSAFARRLTNGVDPLDDPDAALLMWWDTEYVLFRALERHVVSVALDRGFHGDNAVEDFLSFSLRVQNRRKSRSGYAFEHHLGEIFTVHALQHTRKGRTERGAKPDFLFPSQEAYDDPAFPSSGLRMLGAKTTAKDRWRQVLPEADLIRPKHLITMEPAISAQQTDEMHALAVRLVVPAGTHSSYSEHQQTTLWTLADFVEDVKGSQSLA